MTNEQVSIFILREVAAGRIGFGDTKYHLKLLAEAADEIERLQRDLKDLKEGDERIFAQMRDAVEPTGKLKADTGGGCSICGACPVVNVTGTYWLCGPCVMERLPDTMPRGRITGGDPAQCGAGTITGYDSRPACIQCGSLYSQHGKGSLSCPDQIGKSYLSPVNL